MKYFKKKGNKIICKKCGKDDVELIVKVPRSTDGIINPKSTIGLKCRNCNILEKFSKEDK
jgi:late competence protein required for DNA uptake (superfamily II DNA/RNA helicase)